MGQVQARQFPGYGVVYPDGVSGIKVKQTFTDAPKKTINSDGSISYGVPLPTIHELFGGGFTYADGSRVSNREHLEALPGKMKERALKWFDEGREISAVSHTGIPVFDPDKKERPEPVFVLSSDMPVAKDEVTEELNKRMKETKEVDAFAELLKAVKSIEQVVKDQGEQIANLKTSKPVPKRRMININRSEMMKARWAKRKAENGKDVTETNQDMPKV